MPCIPVHSGIAIATYVHSYPLMIQRIIYVVVKLTPWSSLGEQFHAMYSGAQWNSNSHLRSQLPTNDPINHLCSCQTDSMEQSPTLEANSSSASQETFCISYGTRRLCVYKTPPLVLIMSQMNPFDTLPPGSLNTL